MAEIALNCTIKGDYCISSSGSKTFWIARVVATTFGPAILTRLKNKFLGIFTSTLVIRIYIILVHSLK